MSKPSAARGAWVARAQKAPGQGGNTVCLPVAHVKLMDKFMNHQVVARSNRVTGLLNVGPAQYDWALLHGLTGNGFAVLVDKTSGIPIVTPCPDRSWVEDDAYKIVIQIQGVRG